MLRTNSFSRLFLTLLLSTMMALPAPAQARDDDGQISSQAEPGATEGVPVILQQVVVDGKDAWLAVAPVPAAQEAEVVTNLAKHHPEDTVLLVGGPSDPALKAAAKTGFLKNIKTFIAGSADQIPLISTVGSISTKAKNKLREKIQKLSYYATAENASGLMYSLVYSAIQGGFTAYASSSVDAGVSVMTMFMLWNTMVMVRPDWWGKILGVGGNAGTALGQRIASLFGVELSDRDKRIFEVVGKFTMSWAVTVAQGAVVKEMSGDFDELTGINGFLEGLADSAVSGVQNNYNIWDAAVLKKYEQGGLTQKQVQRYFKLQMVFGAIMEGMAFRGVPYVGIFLGTVTAAGLAYIALHPNKQEAVARRAKKLHLAFRSGVAYISNPDSRARGYRRVSGRSREIGKKILSCGDMLKMKPALAVPGHRAVPWEDLQ